MSLQIENLSKTYGTQKALDGLSFSVEDAQVAGLLGPNGAGKSTLMKIVCGYLPATGGRVLVCGLDVRTHSMECRAKIGYLPEHNPLYLDMYVREYLDFVGGIYKLGSRVARKREEVIGRTGLGRESSKKIKALSKGYRQRLGLAQALIHDPEVLILDEPTSGLDPNQLEEIRALIREIGRVKTVILSTHIMQEAEAVCDRILLLDRGHLVADSPTKNLMQGLQGQVLVQVEFNRPVEPDALRALPGVDAVESLAAGRYGIRGAADADLRSALFRFAVDNGLEIITLQREEQSLESVFHRLTSLRKGN